MADNLFSAEGGIRESFSQASQGIKGMFDVYLQQRQRDYDMAQNALLNIEKIKTAANVYGQQSIKDQANKLLNELSQSINTTGKLDYGKYGMLQAGISNLADEKKGWDIFAQTLSEISEMGAKNKESLYSYEKLYTELTEFSKHPELMRSPMDLRNQMMKTYTDNLNDSKLIAKDILTVLQKQNVGGIVAKADGSQLSYTGTVLEGSFVDEKTGQIISPSDNKFYEDLAQKLESAGSYGLQLGLDKVRRNALGEEISAADYIKQVYNTITKGEVKFAGIKSATEVKTEEARLRGAETQADILDINLQWLPKEKAIENKNAWAKYYDTLADTKYKNSQSLMAAAGNNVYNDTNEIVGDLGQNYKIPLGEKEVFLRKIVFDKNAGVYKIGYFEGKQNMFDKYEATGEMKYFNLEKGQSLYNTNLGQTIRNTIQATGSKDDKALAAGIIRNISDGVSLYTSGVQSQQQTQPESQSTQPQNNATPSTLSEENIAILKNNYQLAKNDKAAIENKAKSKMDSVKALLNNIESVIEKRGNTGGGASVKQIEQMKEYKEFLNNPYKQKKWKYIDSPFTNQDYEDLEVANSLIKEIESRQDIKL